jgi:hypothetical protein
MIRYLKGIFRQPSLFIFQTIIMPNRLNRLVSGFQSYPPFVKKFLITQVFSRTVRLLAHRASRLKNSPKSGS